MVEWWNGDWGPVSLLTSSFDTETARWYGVKQYTMGVAKEKDATRGADGGDSRPTSALLMSASKHISLQCRKVNEAYIACKDRNHGNPSACLQEGEAVAQQAQADLQYALRAGKQLRDEYNRLEDKLNNTKLQLQEKSDQVRV